MSRALISSKLLDEKVIPRRLVGKYRRILMDDVMAYKERIPATFWRWRKGCDVSPDAVDPRRVFEERPQVKTIAPSSACSCGSPSEYMRWSDSTKSIRLPAPYA
jgi:hypothetical protein